MKTLIILCHYNFANSFSFWNLYLLYKTRHQSFTWYTWNIVTDRNFLLEFWLLGSNNKYTMVLFSTRIPSHTSGGFLLSNFLMSVSSYRSQYDLCFGVLSTFGSIQFELTIELNLIFTWQRQNFFSVALCKELRLLDPAVNTSRGWLLQ